MKWMNPVTRTDTAGLEELDSGDCDRWTDVWNDTERPVLIAGSSTDDKLCISSYTMSSYEDVAYMGDFGDEDFMDTGFDSDIGSGRSSDGPRRMTHAHGNLGARLGIFRRTRLELFWRCR